MQDNYPWWKIIIFYFLVLIAGYFYFIKPDVIELNNLLLKEKKLQTEFSRMQQVTDKNVEKPPDSHRIKKDFLSIIAISSQQREINLQSIKLLPSLSELENEKHISLVVEGSFEPLRRWLLTLVEQDPDILIENFRIEVAQNTLRMTIGLLMPSSLEWQSITTHHELYTVKRNPFCHQSVTKFSSLTVPIENIKMTGYLSQGKHQMAVLMASTGELIEVKRDDVIGKEHAVVSTIDSDHIELFLRDHAKKIIIKRIE